MEKNFNVMQVAVFKFVGQLCYICPFSFTTRHLFPPIFSVLLFLPNANFNPTFFEIRHFYTFE